MGKVFRLISLIMLAAPAAAQEVTALEPIDRQEVTFDRLKSSSDLVVGAVFGGDRPMQHAPLFRAKLPSEKQDTSLCLRTRSVDGFYQGTYLYTVPAGSGAKEYDFKYDPTDYPDLASRISGRDFAVAAYQGACDAKDTEIYVGSWNVEPATIPDTIILTLNTVGGTSARVYVDYEGMPRATKPVICDKVEANRTTGFDFTCRLAIPSGMQKTSAKLEIQVYRGSTRDRARHEVLRFLR